MTGGSEYRGFTRLILGDSLSPFERLRPHEFPSFLRNTVLRWLVILGTAGLLAIVVVGPNAPGMHFWPIVGLFLGTWALSLLAITRPDEQILAAISYFVVAMGPVFGVAIWLIGPRYEALVCLLPTWVCAIFLLARRRTAYIAAGIAMASYFVVLTTADGYLKPVGHALILAGVVVSAADAFLRIANDLQLIASRLDEQVAEQDTEISRLGQLRRFLTPQIAESVLSGDADLLATHRRRIAVFFCDLRGFTKFSSTAEPEDIAEVLSEYYDALGQAIEAHGATVGSFAGDGVWAFFNDPFPIEDPAGHAFTMALSLREPMRRMRESWERRGFALGYGMSVAYGYATMSTIGFESRSEYTAVGTVVNLGARLCDKAVSGELLIDARAYSELPQDVAGEPTQLLLKGFADPVTAYKVAL